MLRRQLQQISLGPNLRDAIRCDGVEGRGLVEHRVARGAVVAAGRREQEPANTSLTCQGSEPDCGEVIDVVCELCVEITQGIIGERRKVNNCVESPEETAIYVAQI